MGDELKRPGRTMPRAIVYSVIGIMLIYLLLNIGVLGAVPWQEVEGSSVIASLVVTRTWGHTAADVITVLVVVTAFASVFAGLLGGSRVPFNAARDRVFFGVFGKPAPQAQLPARRAARDGRASAAASSLLDLTTVINMLTTVAVLVQSIAQIVALTVLRRRQPELRRPYRQWLYPMPSLVALAGWIYVYASATTQSIVLSLVWIVGGVLAFLGWAGSTSRGRSRRSRSGSAIWKYSATTRTPRAGTPPRPPPDRPSSVRPVSVAHGPYFSDSRSMMATWPGHSHRARVAAGSRGSCPSPLSGRSPSAPPSSRPGPRPRRDWLRAAWRDCSPTLRRPPRPRSRARSPRPAALGLPDLPGSAQSASLSWSTFLTGTHSVRVWVDGPARQRMAVIGELSEADIVHNGRDLWTYTSDSNTASHTMLPARSRRHDVAGDPRR